MGRKAIEKDAESRMAKSIEHFQHEISTVRTGRATPSLLDTVKVDYYGSTVPISQVGSVSAPEPRLLVVQIWDKSAVAAVEKAIRDSNLGLNPSSDGQLVRIPIPELSGERRQSLVKLIKKMAEDARIAVRNVRRDANDSMKKAEKNHEISEDEMHEGLENIQNLTNDFIEKIDELLEHKEKEIMEN